MAGWKGGWLFPLLFLLWPGQSWSGRELTSEGYELAVGGRIYDNWVRALKKTGPQATHPAYPPAGRKSGMDTWRCKECHGWDYRGADGVYGAGSSHFTGIKGVLASLGTDPGKVEAILRDRNHQYDQEMLTSQEARQVALFVTKGLVEMDQVIDRKSGKALGDARRGQAFFETICSGCHGLNGKKVNFGNDAAPEYLGSVARDNPWEGLHKIRSGQAGEPMVSLILLTLQDQADILAHLQTLPVK